MITRFLVFSSISFFLMSCGMPEPPYQPEASKPYRASFDTLELHFVSEGSYHGACIRVLKDGTFLYANVDDAVSKDNRPLRYLHYRSGLLDSFQLQELDQLIDRLPQGHTDTIIRRRVDSGVTTFLLNGPSKTATVMIETYWDSLLPPTVFDNIIDRTIKDTLVAKQKSTDTTIFPSMLIHAPLPLPEEHHQMLSKLDVGPHFPRKSYLDSLKHAYARQVH